MAISRIYKHANALLFAGIAFIFLSLYSLYILSMDSWRGTELNIPIQLWDETYRDLKHLKLPWGTVDLKPGSRILLPAYTIHDPEAPIIVELFGREIQKMGAGALRIDDERHSMSSHATPHLKRFKLDQNRVDHEIIYTAPPGNVLRIWGHFSSPNRQGTAQLIDSSGNLIGPQRLVPVPVRGRDFTQQRLQNQERLWQTYATVMSLTPWVRAGQPDGLYLYRNSLVMSGMLFGMALILTGLAVKAYRFTQQFPYQALSLGLILAVTVFIRYDALMLTIADKTMSFMGQEIVNGLWFDEIAYFGRAVLIALGENRADYKWPIGFPTFAVGIWMFSGISVMAVKLAFVFLQSAIGAIMFVATYRYTRSPWISLVPAALWMIYVRPMRFDYHFLTETPAMMLVALCAMILIGLMKKRGKGQDLIILSLTYAMSVFVRDVFIIFAPFMLYAVWHLFGGTIGERIRNTSVFIVIVMLFWSMVPLLHDNKGSGGNITAYLPIMGRHVETSMGGVGIDADDGATNVAINVVMAYADEVITNPGAFAFDTANGMLRFWRYPWLYANDLPIDKRVWLSIDEALFWCMGVMIIIGGLAGGWRQQPYRWMAFVLFYVTMFHVLLYPNFTPRPKAIYNSIVVMTASFALYHVLGLIQSKRPPTKRLPGPE